MTLNYISKKKYLLYVLGIALFSSLLWMFAKSFAMPIIMIFCSISLLLKNDLRYGLPFIVNVLFVNRAEASNPDTIDIGLIIGGSFLLLVLIIYVFRNKIKFSLGDFGKNTFFLAILGVIPIFWCEYKTINFVFVYLGWVAYLIIYLFFYNTIKKDIKEELSYAMEGLSILITLECLYLFTNIFITTKNFNDIYSLGWGICNEAGIMLCVSLPFIAYKLYTSTKTKEWVYHLCILIFVIFGVFATLSRGTIVFGCLEIGLFLLFILLDKKLYKTTIVFTVFVVLCGIIFMIWKRDMLLQYAIKIVDNNGRFELYEKAISAVRSDSYKVIFGAGMVFDLDFKGEFYVCHSTIYETIAYMGIAGCIAMLYHFILKYRLVTKNKSTFNWFMLIGFVVVDLYGLVDNTYHMYYFMIIFMLIVATIEKSNKQGVTRI